MTRSDEIAVVLMSGGMDSALCAAIARKRNYRIAALHLNYGQKTQNRELRAFNELADYFAAEKRMTVDVSHLAMIGGSSLTDDKIEISSANLENSEIPSSYVPFRNANLLSVAVSWAETLGAKAVFIGATEEDGVGYPDCRKSFFDAFQKALDKGVKPKTKIIIETPIISYSKKNIVEAGLELQIPFNLTWSCYSSETVACGLCDSCALRLRGFARAGAVDPIEYETRPQY